MSMIICSLKYRIIDKRAKSGTDNDDNQLETHLGLHFPHSFFFHDVAFPHEIRRTSSPVVISLSQRRIVAALNWL